MLYPGGSRFLWLTIKYHVYGGVEIPICGEDVFMGGQHMDYIVHQLFGMLGDAKVRFWSSLGPAARRIPESLVHLWSSFQ